jgi:hypothetical protein
VGLARPAQSLTLGAAPITGVRCDGVWQVDAHAPQHRAHALKRCLLALEDETYQDLLRYSIGNRRTTFETGALPEGQAIPASRLCHLQSLVSGDAGLCAALARRHPSL